MTYSINGVRYGRRVHLTFDDLEDARRKARDLLKGASWLVLVHVNESGKDVEHETFR